MGIGNWECPLWICKAWIALKATWRPNKFKRRKMMEKALIPTYTCTAFWDNRATSGKLAAHGARFLWALNWRQRDQVPPTGSNQWLLIDTRSAFGPNPRRSLGPAQLIEVRFVSKVSPSCWLAPYATGQGLCAGQVNKYECGPRH